MKRYELVECSGVQRAFKDGRVYIAGDYYGNVRKVTCQLRNSRVLFVLDTGFTFTPEALAWIAVMPNTENRNG